METVLRAPATQATLPPPLLEPLREVISTVHSSMGNRATRTVPSAVVATRRVAAEVAVRIVNRVPSLRSVFPHQALWHHWPDTVRRQLPKVYRLMLFPMCHWEATPTPATDEAQIDLSARPTANGPPAASVMALMALTVRLQAAEAETLR